MSFGLSFTSGQNDRVVIDSQFSRLCVIYQGTYVGNQEGGLRADVYFPAAITTSEQPLVFIRPTSVNGLIGMSNMQILGTPGNWVGFVVRTYSRFTVPPNGRWFVGNFESRPVANFGLRMFDENNKVIFDNDAQTANFVRTSDTWTYLGSATSAQGVPITIFSAPFNLLETEYLMINNLTLGVSGGGGPGSGGNQLSTIWDYPNRVLRVERIAANNVIVMSITVVVAKIVTGVV